MTTRQTMGGTRRGALLGATCLLAGAVMGQAQFTPMEFVIPLYIAPTYPNGTIAAQWNALHDAAATGATVFGILNPASGPGDVIGENYTATIDYVKGAGAKLLCYVATTYGEKTAADVEAEIAAYMTLYGAACDGIFFDESPYLLGTFVDLYKAHNTFAHAALDGTEEARIVFNTGQAADEQYFSFTPPAEILGYENYYKTIRQLGMPETPDTSVPSQNMLLIHSATELALMPELVQAFMDKAYCKGWGTIYVTDDLFDNGNPWDDPPSFWLPMVAAALNMPTAESCGVGGLKVLAPLLGSNPADVDAIIASASPGDFGDRITVAMNIEITPDAALTTAGAAVRDAGAKVLCYIDADKYGNDLALLEEVVTTFTYFPLNEICAGFFFGSFNLFAALEDMAGLQSLYLKTQKTFLQATVVFAPEVLDGETDFSFSFSFSFGWEDDFYTTDDWNTDTDFFVFPWEDVMTQTDVVALAEALTLALDVGSTTGDIVVVEAFSGSDIIPVSGGPMEHSAAMVLGYPSAPEEVMFDLFAKDWGYGYVTNFEDFESLSTQWAAVVTSAAETEALVVK